jgi:hypothetical protein
MKYCNSSSGVQINGLYISSEITRSVSSEVNFPKHIMFIIAIEWQNAQNWKYMKVIYLYIYL